MATRLTPPDSRASAWLIPCIIPMDIVVLGASQWLSHWDTGARRSRRCAGVDCALCARGVDTVTRYVLLVSDKHSEYLLELRPRHYELINEIQDIHGSIVGSCLRVWRDSTAANAPVHLLYLSRDDSIVERDITRLVATLGLSPVFTREARTSVLTESR